MKRYDLELTATGPVMEEREQGAFVPFSEISGLAEQLADATRQCGVMADLLREAIGEVPQTQSFPSRCDAALAGKLPEQRTAIAKHKSNEAAYRSEILKLEHSKKDLLAALNRKDHDLDRQFEVIKTLEAYRSIKEIWNKHLAKEYTGEDGSIWTLYVLDWGNQSNAPYLINDLGWKLHAMRHNGSGCTVMLSQWMTPIYPIPFGAGVPDALTQDIYSFMQEALALTHPHLQPRAEWAKTVSIHECGLPPRTIKPLEEAGLDTLYKVMSHQGGKLDKVKGIGEKLVDQIIYACELKVKIWEEQYTANQQQEEAA